MRKAHDGAVGALVKQALGECASPGEEKPKPDAGKKDDPTPVNVISLRIAGFTEDEIKELVQKGGGNAALE
jgi:hypothetical protein